MRKIVFGTLASAALALGIAACTNSGSTGSSALPSAPGVQSPAGFGQSDTARAAAAATTTQKAFYTVTTTSRIETWSGATSAPQATATSDAGKVDVTMATAKSGGDFTLRTGTTMTSGSQETFVLRGQFVRTGGNIDQYFYSDTYKGVDTLDGLGSSYSGKDSWPSGELGVIFPFKGGATWSSVGQDNYTIDNLQYSGSKDGKHVGSENQGRFEQQATGFYVGADTWTNTANGRQEYGEHFNVSSPSQLVYTLDMPGYNPEHWNFSSPSNGRIQVAVTAKGKSVFPQGTKDVPDWYPGGRSLPANLVGDKLTVLGSTVKAPAACRLSGLVSAIREDWVVLDPVGGSYSRGTNMYYSWAGKNGFPACVDEHYTHDLIANGLWYVDWLSGKPYYEEKGALLEVLDGVKGDQATPSATTASGWAAAPMATRLHVIQAHLDAVRIGMGMAPGQ